MGPAWHHHCTPRATQIQGPDIAWTNLWTQQSISAPICPRVRSNNANGVVYTVYRVVYTVYRVVYNYRVVYKVKAYTID